MEEPAYAPQQIGEQTHIPQANEKEMYGQQQSYYQQEPQIRQPRRSYEEEQELDRQIREQLNIRREQPKNPKNLFITSDTKMKKSLLELWILY